MNRPITSPWPAVLTSSATITFTPAARACARASSAPEISLWSVTAIAPRPCARAVASSTSTGVAQSGEWSVCMCRSTSISGRPSSRRADRRVAAQRSVGVRRARRRSARAPPPRARRRARACSRPGSGAPSARPSPPWLAVRASRRPKKLSTKRRATSVESSRSVEEWKEPTFSAREWRRAAFEVLGANGSCTWTKSSSTRAQQFLDRARHVDRQRRGPPPRAAAHVEHLADGDHARGCPGRCPRAGSAGRPRAARSSLREARTRSCERDGASTSTRWPRRESSSATRRDVRVDLVLLRLPRIGRDVGDREALLGHDRSIRRDASAREAACVPAARSRARPSSASPPAASHAISPWTLPGAPWRSAAPRTSR